MLKLSTMKTQFFLTTSVFFLFFQTFAQSGALFAPKINAVGAYTTRGLVMHEDHDAAMEFEPNFTYEFSGTTYDSRGKVIHKDSVDSHSQLSLRITYALTKSWELGLNLGDQLNDTEIAVKRCFGQDYKYLHALYGSVVVNTTNDSREQIRSLERTSLTYIFSSHFTDTKSIDINLVGTFLSDHEQFEILFATDYGVYKGSTLFAVSITSLFRESGSYLTTFYPGVSFEHSEEYAVAFNGSFDLFGKLLPKTWGLNMAFTFILN